MAADRFSHVSWRDDLYSRWVRPGQLTRVATLPSRFRHRDFGRSVGPAGIREVDPDRCRSQASTTVPPGGRSYMRCFLIAPMSMTLMATAPAIDPDGTAAIA